MTAGIVFLHTINTCSARSLDNESIFQAQNVLRVDSNQAVMVARRLELAAEVQ